jgi:hypothetical protein
LPSFAGDTVTCTFDSGSGELSIGVNEAEPEVAIRGIEGTAYPAVVFYAGMKEAAINSIACVKPAPSDVPPAGETPFLNPSLRHSLTRTNT